MEFLWQKFLSRLSKSKVIFKFNLNRLEQDSITRDKSLKSTAKQLFLEEELEQPKDFMEATEALTMQALASEELEQLTISLPLELLLTDK